MIFLPSIKGSEFHMQHLRKDGPIEKSPGKNGNIGTEICYTWVEKVFAKIPKLKGRLERWEGKKVAVNG